jgi:hypothetical protein
MGESNLEDEERVRLFGRAFRDGRVAVSQPGPGEPLQVTTLKKFSELPSAEQQSYGKKRWERMGKQVYRFVAAVNQGLGDPFEYEDSDDRAVIVGVKNAALTYLNPFEQPRKESSATPIDPSENVARRRAGWRIVGRDIILFLKPGAPPREVEAGKRFDVVVGGEFTLASGGNSGARLRLFGDAAEKIHVLQAEVMGGTAQRVEFRHGDYFVWDGHPYAVFRSDRVAENAEDGTVGGLVFTKTVNGKPVRVQVLGRAAANLIGSTVGGETSYIDGAFLHDKARRLVLTIDPELQAGAYFILKNAVDQLPTDPPPNIRRKRYASMTILDAETGQVLANAGLPGFDPAWEATRVILANRQRIIYNAANFAHMPGSTVKVLTSAIGYLLTGNGTGEMLPKSINQLAVRQAFANAYGSGMPPGWIVDDSEYAHATEKGEEYFKQNGPRRGLQRNFTRILNSAFHTAHFNFDDRKKYASMPEGSEQSWREDLVPRDFTQYFDEKARFEFFPEGSRMPFADAGDLETFAMMAKGNSETKFTTLRLAAILGAISSGRVMRPYIVESVYDDKYKGPDNRLTYAPAGAFTDFGTVLPDFEGANSNVTTMSSAVTKFLRDVCDGKPGTGYYIKNGREIYMTHDDPFTPEDEAEERRGDFGKTGTGDHGKDDPNYNDSAFVYRHGRYIIAVWLERAEGGGVFHPAHRVLNQTISFIDSLGRTRQ